MNDFLCVKRKSNYFGDQNSLYHGTECIQENCPARFCYRYISHCFIDLLSPRLNRENNIATLDDITQQIEPIK